VLQNILNVVDEYIWGFGGKFVKVWDKGGNKFYDKTLTVKLI
jgi:hypothetical protein